MTTAELKKGIYRLVLEYRTRADGGPGSGNFGHKGRPGEVGGSGKSIDITEELQDYQLRSLRSESTFVIGGWGMKSSCKAYMKKNGASDSTLDKIDNLIDGHRNGGEWQEKADAEIVSHIQDRDDIGEALLDRSEFETACYEEWKKHHKGSDQLDKNGELRLYRKGDRKNGVEAWSISEEGADMGHGGIGYDHESTLEQLQREGYSVIGGMGTMAGAPGEGEITFVKTRRDNNADGGPGSGNFGHKGRKGEVGGSEPQDGVLLKPTKTTRNKRIYALADSVKDGNDQEIAEKISKELNELAINSVITIPENEFGDPASKYIKIDENHWQSKDNGWIGSSIDMAWDFMYEEPTERAYISKSAETPEETAHYKELERQKDWRNQKSPWAESKSINEKSEVKLTKGDLEKAGYGYKVISKDGDEIESYGDGEWYNTTKHRKADSKEVRGATFAGDYFDINLGLNGLDRIAVKDARYFYEKMPENVRSKYEKEIRRTSVDSSDCGAYYAPADHKIYIDKEDTCESFFHEMSHALDYGCIDVSHDVGGFNRNIRSASENIDFLCGHDKTSEDFETMASIVGWKTNGEGWFGSDEERDHAYSGFLDWARKNHTYVDESGETKEMHGFSAVSDAISALTLNKSGGTYLYGGHEADYWMTRSSTSPRNKEYWAQYCTLRIMGWNKALELLKKITPNTYAACEETYKEAFENGEKKS